MIRITRIGRIIIYMRAKDDTKISLKLVQLGYLLCIYIHFISCIWFIIVENKKNWIPPTDFMYYSTDFYEKSELF